MGLAEAQNTLVAPFEPVVVTQPARVRVAAVSISASIVRPLDSTVGIGFVLLDLDGGTGLFTGAASEEERAHDKHAEGRLKPEHARQ
jgi:hypothetical protein